MERQPVKSSNIKTVGYDPATYTLEIEFASGGIYDYYNVPEEVYHRFINAESLGRFFAVDIRACYEFKCMNPKPKSEKEESHGQNQKSESKETPCEASTRKTSKKAPKRIS